ncbi:hypothetical protein DS67_05270 [Mesotoga sp. SC_4PWA21]|nr:hypothetical protein DS67_05270 [Mesotoga sp. SC_4PWA21]
MLKDQKTAITWRRLSSCKDHLNWSAYVLLVKDLVFDLIGGRVLALGRSTEDGSYMNRDAWLASPGNQRMVAHHPEREQADIRFVCRNAPLQA